MGNSLYALILLDSYLSMTKTISFEIGNPITALRKMNAKRVISKLEKQIAKRQNKIAKLNSKGRNHNAKN